MTRVILDSSVLIDHLRGRAPAARALVLDALERRDELWSSYVVRAEVLAGMRPEEREETYGLLRLIRWAEVDEARSEAAGALGREYLRRYPGIGVPDLIVAALAQELEADLKTLNVKHFPMFPGLRPAY